jgi:transposase
VKGRKRHVLVDTLGLVWAVLVLPADVQDRDAAKLLLLKAAPGRTRVRVVFADGGYNGPLAGWLKLALGWVLQLVHKPPGAAGFRVLPKRWIVERTFAWISQSRRHGKDYEALPEVSEAMLQVSMIALMLRRLA